MITEVWADRYIFMCAWNMWCRRLPDTLLLLLHGFMLLCHVSEMRHLLMPIKCGLEWSMYGYDLFVGARLFLVFA